MSRPAFDKYTPDELEAAIEEHLDAMKTDGEPLIIEELAVRLGVNKHTLAKYRKHEPGEIEGDHAYDAHSAAIKRAYARCEAWLAKKLHSDKGSPVGAIFALKCGHAWQETPIQIKGLGGFSMVVDTSAADDTPEE